MARCNTTEPVPMSEPSSTVQPSRCARWPIVQSAPTTVSSWRVQCSTAPSCTDVRAPITMRLWSPRSTAWGQMVAPGPITTLPMIVHSGCTNASGSICGTMSARAYRAMDSESSLSCVDEDIVNEHVHTVAEQGYTIVKNAIEPEFVDTLGKELQALERLFQV